LETPPAATALDVNNTQPEAADFAIFQSRVFLQLQLRNCKKTRDL